MKTGLIRHKSGRARGTMKKRLNNKGFTLLEMVIAVAIVSLLVGSVVVVFPQWLTQYVMLRQTAEATEIMDVIASGIQDELLFSKERTWDEQGLHYVRDSRIGTLPLNDTECAITYEDGSLTILGKPQIFGAVFDSGFYGDMTAKLVMKEQTRSRDGAPVLVAQIEVYSSQGQLLASEAVSVLYYNR